MITTPAQALAELRAGNQRFVTGTRIHPNQDAEHRVALAQVQEPFAVIFGCSDSRLAAEIIFDRGLGDLFVIRTAGHTVGPEVLGSIEYAVAVLRTPLVVVLGHNSCGAVTAARDVVRGGAQPEGYVRALVEAIVPSVDAAGERQITDVDGIVDVHIERTVARLGHDSTILAAALEAGQCAVVGMSYQLGPGEVRLIPDTPVGEPTTSSWQQIGR